MKIRQTFLNMRLPLSLFLVGGLIVAGCSKKEEQQGSSSEASSTSTGEAAVKKSINLSSSLVSYIPQESVGFFLWEGKHPAYTKLANSPWGATNNSTDWTTAFKDAGKDFDELREVLSTAGLDPLDKKTWKGVFAEAALFASPAPTADKKPAVGLVFRADASMKLSDALAALKKGLAAKDVEVTDVKVAHGSAFSLRDKAKGSGAEPAYLGWNDNLGVFSNTDWALDSVLASKGDKAPAVVSSANFEKAVKGLPEDKIRFATGYVDIEKMAEVADKLSPNEAKSAEKIKSGEVPLRALSFAMGMDETPRTNVRVVYDASKNPKNQWLNSLSASSSGNLLAALPSKPLLFLSLDGQTIRKVKDSVVATMDPQQGKMVSGQLAFLDGLKRIGLTVRTAPMGQSMLPIPDIMLVFETSDAAATQQQLQGVLGMAAKGSGMPAMPWSDKQINNIPVKSMVSPFGVGVFLATNNNLVIASSTEAQMKGALGADQSAAFSKGMPTQVEQVFAKEQTLGNLYLNFEEVGAMMETMGGMLAMYAPQNQEAGKYLQPENIEAMKKMGTVIGSVKLEEGMIGIDSFYDLSKPAA